MNTFKKLLGPLVLVAILAAGAAAWLNRWYIYDTVRLRGYTPPAQVVELAYNTTMDAETRRIFFANHPKLLEKSNFRQHCPTGEVSIVLGCYVSNDGIYLADIMEERLAGIVEVTAAHEVLHAAYDRLTGSEKERIDRLLNEAFKDVKNERIRKNVEEYRANGADVTNELHSILGTEVRQLPKQLEDYYAQYFDERQKIVEYSEQYEAAFTELKELVEKYDQQLKSLKSQIDSLQASLRQQNQQLQAERQRLDQLRSSGQTEQYNSAVPGFNALVNGYNADVNRVRSLIDQYNTTVAKRNDIVVEQGELIEAIDSRPETINQ